MMGLAVMTSHEFYMDLASHFSDSKWITSDEAREDVHRLRNENMAILVGVNTVLKDDPGLQSL